MNKSDRRVAHTEHILFECWVSDSNAPDIHLFRAPTVLDGRGTHKRLPHKVAWRDLSPDDKIIALKIDSVGSGIEVLSILQFWHVLEVREGEARAMVNNIVGSSGDGEYVYDSLAGLLGLQPSTPE